MPILNSGGATGADSLFGEMAKKAGHVVRHYTFADHEKVNIDSKDQVILTPSALKLADEALKKANETLKRSYPSRNPYTNNLLRRNFWQIQNTQAVYAVAPLSENGYIDGGTAWAVQMAIDRGISFICLFDLKTNQWFQWHGGFKFPKGWMKDTVIVRPQAWEVYTGIGSRSPPKGNLTPAGEQAIRDLYDSTTHNHG